MSFSNKVQSFLKSLSGGDPSGEPPKKDEKTDPDLGTDPDKNEGGEGGSGDGDMEKGGKLVDATDVLNGLVAELEEMRKSLQTLAANQNDIGESIVGVAEMVNRIANSPIPPKSAMAKGGLGAAGGGAFPAAVQQGGIPTEEEFERAQSVLTKSYQAGEITMLKSEMISSDLQKAMRIPGYKMNPEYFNFLASKMRTA
jgi:hypothetical protein